MCKLLLPAIALLCSTQASAITVQFSELPTELQNCFQTNSCISLTGPNLTTNLETTGAAAFQYAQLNGSSYDWKWLMRYDLLTPPGTVGGTAWISAQSSYDVAGSDAHGFTLYFNSPANPYLLPSPITLTLNDTDLTDGSAFRSQIAGTIETEPGIFTFDVSVTGDLGINLPLCLAEGCGTSAGFNLLHMNYVNGIFGFNPLDARGLLFSQNSWYDCGYEGCGGYSQSQSLYVHPVPLPASALLFISGLAGGAVGVRRKKPATRA